MRRLALLWPALALLLAACRPDSVELVYRFDPQRTLSYVMTADASSSWVIGGSSGSGSYRVVFHVVESVREKGADDAVVEVRMTPIEVREEGLPSPGNEESSFVLRAGSHGEVLDILEVGEIPAGDLEPGELAFIGTYRPPLPLEPVRLGTSWESEQQVDLGEVFQQITTTGHLGMFTLDEGRPVARLAYEGSGPLVWTMDLSQGEAQLSGSSSTTTTATIDLERGELRRAESITRGLFDVEVATDTGFPLTGTLELELRLELRPAA